MFGAAALAVPRSVDVVLLDCSATVRSARLRGPREQPELITPQMDQWAVYLREEARVRGLPIIDTTDSTIDQSMEKLATLVRRRLDSDSANLTVPLRV